MCTFIRKELHLEPSYMVILHVPNTPLILGVNHFSFSVLSFRLTCFWQCLCGASPFSQLHLAHNCLIRKSWILTKVEESLLTKLTTIYAFGWVGLKRNVMISCCSLLIIHYYFQCQGQRPLVWDLPTFEQVCSASRGPPPRWSLQILGKVHSVSRPLVWRSPGGCLGWNSRLGRAESPGIRRAGECC